jgi:hypothetical protein
MPSVTWQPFRGEDKQSMGTYMTNLRQVVYAISATLSISISSTSFAEDLNLTLSCLIKGLNDSPPTYYIDRSQFQDRNNRRVFSFRSFPMNPELAKISGDFTNLLEGRTNFWTAEPDEYYFQTLKDSEGKIHHVTIDRIKGGLLHFIDYGNGKGLIYQYDLCEKAAPQF